MRDLPTIEQEVKTLKAQVLDLKKSQPFFNGQLETNVVQTSNNYDFTLNVEPFSYIRGVIRFKNQSKLPPFSKLIAIIKSSPTTELSSTLVFQELGDRTSALYAQGSIVAYQFRFMVGNIPSNTIYIKYYAITNDVAGEFQIFPNDWYWARW